MLVKDPTAKLRPEKEPQHERFLDQKEVQSLVESCPAWLRPVVLTAYHTGARRSDLVGSCHGKLPLSWRDVDLQQRRIAFRDTKEKEPRHVPIGSDLLSVLRNLPSRLRGEAVFLGEDGEPVKPDRVYRAFKRAARAAGLKQATNLRLHDLRHSCASQMVRHGVSLYVVQRILGHKSSRMTQRYAHLQDEVLAQAVEKLSGTNLPQVR